MKYINIWILLSLLLLSTSLYSKDKDQTTEGYTISKIRITNISIHSATASNAMNIVNSRGLNQIGSDSKEIVKSSISNFQGQGLEWETDIRHSNFIRTNYFLSHASLSSGNNKLNDLSTLNYSASGSPVSLNDLSFKTFSNNTLITSRIAFLTDFFFFENSSNKLLENLALRIGFETYGNTFTASSKPYPYVGTSNGTPYSGIDSTYLEKVKFSEVFGNAVIGLNYKFNLTPLSSLDFGLEYFQSFANDSRYENRSITLYISPSISFPGGSKIGGIVKSELEGFRTSLGYRYDFSEITFFRISFAYQESVQKIKETNLPDSSGFLSNNALQFVSTVIPPMGPFPTARDTRSQIGIEFGYKY
ncbi:hypothetical protein [Leptospira hartskeerlii]|uniref:hypothetical protein n=1 Tax=Leptospira hartskeerlii TaxID=2023177 RepID=UPI000F63A744|nr:hypothetical protein [Leptospira hartskeerlii]